MFPIRDHNPSRRTPYVTYTLLALNIVIFLAYFPLASSDQTLGQFFHTWGMIPANVTSGQSYYTLMTSIFLHGGWMHLIGNMLFLWIFGDNLEDALGHVGYLAFYLICGVLASYGQILSDPNSLIPNVGASGAIAGVLGGYLLLYPRARVDVLLILIVFIRIFPVPAWVMLGIWFGIQVVSGVAVDASGGGVAYWAHAGGFIVGLVGVIPVWLSKGAAGWWRRTDYHPPHPEAEYKIGKSSIPKVKK